MQPKTKQENELGVKERKMNIIKEKRVTIKTGKPSLSKVGMEQKKRNCITTIKRETKENKTTHRSHQRCQKIKTDPKNT